MLQRLLDRYLLDPFASRQSARLAFRFDPLRFLVLLWRNSILYPPSRP